MQVSKEIQRYFDRAKIKLMQHPDSMFITTVLFSLKFSWDQSIPTACTNGLNLRINPDFFEKLNEDERVGLMVHEAWHVAFQHTIRVGERDFRTWNIATDYAINNMLDSRGYSLPEGGLIDHQYDEMTSEKIYKELSDNPDQMPNQFQSDMEPAHDPNATPDQVNATEQEIQDILIKAATQSKMHNDSPGTIPGEIEIALNDLLNPKLPWYQILQRYMSGLAPDDYSYRKFNRRFLPEFYLPTLYSEALGNITVAVDTSGSITDEQFNEFISEIHQIKEQLSPQTLTIQDFDTSIKAEHLLHEHDDVRHVKFSGRGGTDVREVLEKAKEDQPEALLIFTDGYFYKHDIDPKIPVIWVIHSNGYKDFEYPFGKIIEYPEN